MAQENANNGLELTTVFLFLTPLSSPSLDYGEFIALFN